ncbi:hypothetical protein EDI_019090 [Entamoeba dispar SAW760]|uniref:Uncharacterized protein n=1 Tax=Entamoeba dispar (strain ATCC PRA-260 / SAW760) TaxID=370354 RepID=B0EAR5_ENTDS|nr:uncharacterized protein EDI_019090 [Entamoeba dispar SAW760]EDR28380.1 hypothetical protein EDI_019090 [Entamoeba dispar SAW760]|eukprot:EDR28380.1 hypothetical protein EDI_019090 [Entamoeba dispar SAW760]
MSFATSSILSEPIQFQRKKEGFQKTQNENQKFSCVSHSSLGPMTPKKKPGSLLHYQHKFNTTVYCNPITSKKDKTTKENNYPADLDDEDLEILDILLAIDSKESEDTYLDDYERCKNPGMCLSLFSFSH